MKIENAKTKTEGQISRQTETTGAALAFGIIGLSEAFLLISATVIAPTAIIPAAIIVALGWSIVIAIRMWPNEKS
jgi:hypothetical protein